MIHLALWIAAALFLAYVGLVAFAGLANLVLNMAEAHGRERAQAAAAYAALSPERRARADRWRRVAVALLVVMLLAVLWAIANPNGPFPPVGH